MRARRRPATTGLAVGGVLLGHWLAYSITSPPGTARTALLRATGHAYLGLGNDVALVTALIAMATMFIGQLMRPAPVDRLHGVTARVVRFQVSAFLLVEVLERLTAGSPLTGLVHSWILPVGVAAQVGIGYVAGQAIRWLLRAADRVAVALDRVTLASRRVVQLPLSPKPVFVPAGRQLSAVGVRGPPSSV